ncbi:MAG: TolC family protein [Rickettsiales bacterium]|jgi:outer membrane protein, heavy metal efflux system|nr:TolC family protein [Rickettsiales bacterium]
MTLLRNILISLILFCASQAMAASFDEYLLRLENHPQILSILAAAESSNQLAKAAMGLPDPEVILGVDNVPVDDFQFDQFLPTAKVLGFNQMIPNHGLRKAKANKYSNISAKQKLVAEYQSAHLKAYLITALVELEKVKKLEKYTKQQLKLYKSLENYFAGQLEAGRSIYGSFSEMDVERAEIEQDLNNLKSERIAIEAELIRLIDEVPTLTISKVQLVKWSDDLNQIYPVRIMRDDLKIADSSVTIANKSYNSNYGISALYKQREEGSGYSGEDWFSVHTAISIPLWYNSNQQPKLRAAMASKQKVAFSLDDTKRLWKKQLTIIISKRNTALENIKLLQKKHKAIKNFVSSAKRNYEAGSAELESVLDAEINALTIASQLEKQKSRFLKLSASFNSHIIPNIQ